jgi:hypothetical protein
VIGAVRLNPIPDCDCVDTLLRACAGRRHIDRVDQLRRSAVDDLEDR